MAGMPYQHSEIIQNNFYMRRSLAFVFAFVVLSGLISAAESPFEDGRLQDATLRLNYIFSGKYGEKSVLSLADAESIEGWYGRRVNLKTVPVQGEGQLTMTDKATGDTLYRFSFSTLFQEWLGTDEAKSVRKAFENVFLVPMPSEPVVINVKLFNSRNSVDAEYSHVVDPADILIRKVKPSELPECRRLLHSDASEDKIDVAIIAEGYTKKEIGKFYKDAGVAVSNLLAHEPFKSMQDKFNITAVATVSEDSGVSVPRENVWKNTALNSNFDTFYSDRYLTTLYQFKMHDKLAGLPYETIIILANSDVYGGGGIYGLYTIASTGHGKFGPVVVHEFGHSFAGLTDEYAYDGTPGADQTFDVEPWQKNVTTKVDFESKWKDLYDAGVVGLVEGAAYQPKGYWRPCEDCRMRTNESPEFCPVCRRAIEETILYLTEPEH